MVYSTQERVEMVRLYYENGSNARAAARVFNESHPEKNVRHKYVLELLQKFTETGSVLNIKRNAIQIVNNEDAAIEVLGQVAALENTASITEVSRVTGVSRTSVWRVLHKFKFHPYKIKLVHELNDDDFDRRIEFCELMTERINNNQNYLYNICFSDESSFSLNGEVNRHNCRYWSDTNPHLIRETHTQRPQRLNVWAGILGNHIIGPLFIDGNLNGDKYLDMLQNDVTPLIIQAVRDDPNLLDNEIVFQQDGAPAHYAVQVREFLNHRFRDHWIGRRGPTEWPARSPDLTPLDFFLWGHLKNKVYATQPTSLDDLRRKIVSECRRITPEILQNVRSAFELRLYHCVGVNGGHFEHLIH